MTADVRTIEARVHGRYLVRQPSCPRPWPLLVGFHGYAEDAETHLAALAHLPGADRWLMVSMQALHPFYTRERRVVANWMTRQDRDHAIADNMEYVRRVLEALKGEFQVERPLAFVGFSQGAAMAYRSAVRHQSDALIVLAGDVPPDVAQTHDVRWPRVLIGRGTSDTWYTEEKHVADLATLDALSVTVESCVFEGGHEWTGAFNAAAGRLLVDIAAT